jgi:molybdopterin-guanine dinucleotide biosynthesis protein A
MAADKCALPFGPTTMLGRVLQALDPVVQKIVLVGHPDQQWSSLLPPNVPSEKLAFAHDRIRDLGPLEGLRAGLQALHDQPPQNAALVTGCDYPLLSSSVIELLFDELSPNHDAAVPFVDNRPSPLPGVYRLAVASQVESLLANDRRSLKELLAALRVNPVDSQRIVAIDPKLLSLRSANTPQDYAEMLNELQ